MNIYRVGGAVRDHLLGFPFHETDWVVVGSTPENMLAAGYKQVGRDFPVFLHPKTKEEYALARTERKSLPGHHGFEVHAGRLSRWKKTCNVGISQSTQWQWMLRTTLSTPTEVKPTSRPECCGMSPHFIEDPLRVLCMRFAARYHHLASQLLMKQWR